jgi:maltose alpha-D-glucosyltransferase/alpha-amylase
MSIAVLFLVLISFQIAQFGNISNATQQVTPTEPAQITGKVYVPKCPDWVNTAIFYQIYPQTFYDTNNDGIGDLQGIIQKLDYVKSLGVDGIWINPFVESPFRDAGYDASDYYRVAPRYGTNQDAKELFDQAHKKGLKVLFDYVISYTSIDHPWFKSSCDPVPNKYSNWYIWTNNTRFPGMEKYSDKFIQGYCNRNGNFMINFFWHQPALNFGFCNPDPNQPWQLPVDHPDVLALRQELKNVLRCWMDMGADGFRADMAGALVKGDTENKSAIFWREIRKILDTEYPNAFAISEWSHPISAIDGGFHADFLHWFRQYNDLLGWASDEDFKKAYFNKTGQGNITAFLKVYMEHLKGTQGRGYVCVPIGNHDLSRIRSHGRNQQDLEVIFAFLLTMPGVPFIYYGDEIGMRQLTGIRTIEGAYGGRAGNRTPMQWSSAKNAGFSTAEPEKLYFPVDPNADSPNVAAQENDPNSLLNRVRKLIQLRKQQKALISYAEFVPVYAKENEYPFIYARAYEDEMILVILNPAGRTAQAHFILKPVITRCELLAGTPAKIQMREGDFQVSSEGQSYSVYKLIK